MRHEVSQQVPLAKNLPDLNIARLLALHDHGPSIASGSRMAAGRICSNLYVSDLSFADCIYSDRQAARSIANGGSQKAGITG